jgi:SecD/SecF fusion protein
MKKISLLIVFSSFVLLTNCKLSGDKTEIKIHLSEAEYIYSIAINKDDSVFNIAYNFALKESDPEAEFLTVFEKKYSEICPDCMLSSHFSTFELRDKINTEKTNNEVIGVLNEEVRLAMSKTISVLKNRIESFCKPVSKADQLINKTNVSVTELPGKNTWSFTVNRKTDGEHLSTLLSTHVRCGFWETYELSEIWDFLSQANRLLSDPSMAVHTEIKPAKSETDTKNTLFELLKPSVGENGDLTKGCIIGYSQVKDIVTVNKYLALPAISILLPRNLKFMWAKIPLVPDKEQLIAIKVSSRDGLALLDESVIAATSSDIKKQPPQFTVKMNPEGARMLSRLTSENIGRNIVFELNNIVISNYPVNEEITGGEYKISGGFTPGEISDFDVLLGSGIMPEVGVRVISIL